MMSNIAFPVDAVLTGLRLGAIILWAWVGLRVAFDSWSITGEPQEVRIQGWRYFRPSLLVLSALIVFVFSPADILAAHGVIAGEQRHALNAIGALGLHVVAILLHLGLDVANTHTRRALPVYMAISAATLAFAFAKGAA